MNSLGKLYNFLDIRYKLYLSLVIGFILTQGLLEMAAISFIPMLFDSSPDSEFFYILNNFIAFLNIDIDITPDKTNVLIVIFCIVFLLKNLLIIILKFLINILLMMSVSGIERATFKNLLDNNFQSLSAISKNKTLQLFSVEIVNFRNQFLIPFNHFISELVVASALVFLIFYISDTKFLLLFSTLFLLLLLVIYFVSIIQGYLGRLRLKLQTDLLKPVSEFLKGFAVIKNFKQEDRFDGKFKLASIKIANVLARAATVSGVTINLMEIVIFGLIAFVFGFSLITYDISFSTTAVFGLVAYRLYPSLNRMTQSFAKMQFGIAAANFLVDYLPKNEIYQKEYIQYYESNDFNDPLIKIQNLSFDYDKNKKNKLLKNLSMELPTKGLISIQGPNGAGKSTFLHLMLGFLEPSIGKLSFRRIDHDPKLVYVPQSSFIESGTIKENISFGRTDLPQNKFVKILDSINLTNMYEQSGDQIIGDEGTLLSGGQNQKINIARAVYNDFDMIALDEPSSAQDKETSRELSNLLKEISKEKLVILISHEIELNSIADYSINLPEGKLVKND